MTAGRSVMVDGQLRRADQPVFFADDRGVRHGDGAFETLCCRGGRILAWSRHLARLTSTLQFLDVAVPDRALLAEQAGQLIAVNALHDAVVRLIVTAGRGGPRRGRASRPTVVWTSATLPAPQAPVDLLSVPDPGGNLRAHKTLAYLPHLLARPAPPADALYTVDGRVREGPAWNLFARVQGRWYTPPADGTILPGVARSVVLELLDVTENTVQTEQIEAAFTTNAIRWATPVATIDGRPLATPDVVPELLRRYPEAAG